MSDSIGGDSEIRLRTTLSGQFHMDPHKWYLSSDGVPCLVDPSRNLVQHRGEDPGTEAQGDVRRRLLRVDGGGFDGRVLRQVQKEVIL